MSDDAAVRPTNEVLVKGALKRAVAVLNNTLRGDCPKTVENLLRDVLRRLEGGVFLEISEETYSYLIFYSKRLLPLFQVEEVTQLDHNAAAVKMGYTRTPFGTQKDDEVGVRAVLDELNESGHDLLELVHTRDTCAVQRIPNTQSLNNFIGAVYTKLTKGAYTKLWKRMYDLYTSNAVLVPTADTDDIAAVAERFSRLQTSFNPEGLFGFSNGREPVFAWQNARRRIHKQHARNSLQRDAEYLRTAEFKGKKLFTAADKFIDRTLLFAAPAVIEGSGAEAARPLPPLAAQFSFDAPADI